MIVSVNHVNATVQSTIKNVRFPIIVGNIVNITFIKCLLIGATVTTQNIVSVAIVIVIKNVKNARTDVENTRINVQSRGKNKKP
ncbi:hypothetical protein RCG17_06795 [Neobacillus sp. PS3-12]|jgi:hypothetical protein|uniref:hypothetical protein n=1 Tax=Neobacillus sp. PS3-12 TaxID=3070677 RepID=UPI0027E06D89|nr:hypothetical protein [Neobacillus sp. PS3-12]WML54348.1 hypothetical protein RCG17_06795 [Neobacillus sp. PS3-12]